MIQHIDLGTTPGARLRRLVQLRRDGLITLGGNRNLKIYGTLTCRSGRRLTVENRVFFRDEAEAVTHGYRPCGHCLRDAYLAFVQHLS